MNEARALITVDSGNPLDQGLHYIAADIVKLTRPSFWDELHPVEVATGRIEDRSDRKPLKQRWQLTAEVGRCLKTRAWPTDTLAVAQKALWANMSLNRASSRACLLLSAELNGFFTIGSLAIFLTV